MKGYKLGKVSIYLVLIVILTIVIISISKGSPRWILQTIYDFITESNRTELITNIFDHRLYSNISLLFFILLNTIVLALLTISLFKYDVVFSTFKGYMASIKESFKRIVKGCLTLYFLVAVFIPFIVIIYCAITHSVITDEALTYYKYVDMPFFSCFFTYSAPNNHILFSFLASITNLIPFGDILLKLRLTSVIASVFTWMLMYSFVKKYFFINTAIFTTAIFPLCIGILYYSFYGRGYSLLIMFVMISVYAVYNILQTNRDKDWFIFVLSSILAFLTIPTYLYPYISFNLLLVATNPKNIKKIIYCGLFTVLGTVLVYSPIILTEGIEAIIENDYVLPISRREVIHNLGGIIKGWLFIISGIRWEVVSLLLLFASVTSIYFSSKRKITILTWVFFLIIPICLLIVQSIIPFTRTFIYLSVILVLLGGIALNGLFSKIKQKYIYLLIIVIQLGQLKIYQRTETNPGASEVTQAQDVSDKIKGKGTSLYIVSRNISTIYMFETLYQQRYFKDMDKCKFICHLDDYNENKFAISADTLNNYDFVVIESRYDSTKFKPVYHSNRRVNVYNNTESKNY